MLRDERVPATPERAQAGAVDGGLCRRGVCALARDRYRRAAVWLARTDDALRHHRAECRPLRHAGPGLVSRRTWRAARDRDRTADSCTLTIVRGWIPLAFRRGLARASC